MKGFKTVPLLLEKQECTKCRDEQHFMRVPDQAVGSFQPVDKMPMPAAQQYGTAVSRVDVQPDSMPFADIGNIIQRIKGSHRVLNRRRRRRQ